MKNVLFIISFVFSTMLLHAQCQLDTIIITRISCQDTLGKIDVTYTGASNYMWYNASNILVSTAEDLESDTCGVFTLIVLDVNLIPCHTIDKFLGCPLQIAKGRDPILCFGGTGTVKRPTTGGIKFDPNGSVNLTGIEDGDEYYFYTWYKADDSLGTNTTLLTDTTSNLYGASKGWYKTIVTDAMGCQDSIDFHEFREPSQISIQSLTVNPIQCYGMPTTLNLQVSGGTTYSSGISQYTYSIIQGSDTSAFFDLSNQSPNSFIINQNTISFEDILAASDSTLITILDSNGCNLDTTIFIFQPDTIVANISTNAYPLCAYDSVWILLDSIFGGISPYSFQWNDGTSSDSLFVNGGSHKIFITDAMGCQDSTNGITIITPLPIIVSDSIINIHCNGDSTGQVFLQLSGGTGVINADWGIGINPLALSAGNHPVMITDSLGCIASYNTVNITENQAIIINLNPTNPTCMNHNNGNVVAYVNGGVAPYNYLWNTGSTADSLDNISIGTYIVQITDSLNCTQTDSIELQSTDSLMITFSNYSSPLSCANELTAITANISGGTTINGNYSIVWDNGSSNQQTILSGGNHFVIVTDAAGCQDTAYIQIDAPSPMQLNTSSTNPTCLGNDGTISVNASGGTPPFNYIWSTGATGNNITGLTAGTYWVFVSDSCENDTITITLAPYNSTLNISNFSLTHPSCSENDGIIDLTVSGGFSPYSYLWNNGTNTADLSGVGSGTYYVQITDNCGQTTTGSFTLNPQANTVSTSGSYNYLSLWSSVSVNGGFPPYIIEWNTIFMTADSIRGLCEGIYPITVTDSKNCKDTFSIDVAYNVDSLISLSTFTVIDSSWGIGPFSYLWSDGQTTPHADSLCAGTHTVVVTALGGPLDCELSSSLSISDLTAYISPESTTIDCENKSFDGKITVDPSGSTPPYSFLWSTGDTTNRIEENLHPGKFSVTIFDKNGCTLDTSITIYEIGAECLPNVFTPNGDGINEIWELEDAFLYDDSTIKIYGRFGEKIFESVGYKTPWNGTTKNGKEVPDGAYFYSIILKDGRNIKGTVTVIR